MRACGRLAGRLLAVTVLAGVVAGVGGGGAALAGPPAGSVGIRLVDVPADATDNPRAEVYIVDRVHPGDTITRRVEVTNATATALPIEVYPGAARQDGDQFVSLDPGTRNPLVRWTVVDPGVLTLAPGAHALATVTITVPDDARSGQHYGVVWAQPPASEEGNVATVNRVGVRIYLSVAEDSSGVNPGLLIGVPALAILLGAGAARAGRPRRPRRSRRARRPRRTYAGGASGRAPESSGRSPRRRARQAAL